MEMVSNLSVQSSIHVVSELHKGDLYGLKVKRDEHQPVVCHSTPGEGEKEVR
jgi:hypothetical protein